MHELHGNQWLVCHLDCTIKSFNRTSIISHAFFPNSSSNKMTYGSNQTTVQIFNQNFCLFNPMFIFLETIHVNCRKLHIIIAKSGILAIAVSYKLIYNLAKIIVARVDNSNIFVAILGHNSIILFIVFDLNTSSGHASVHYCLHYAAKMEQNRLWN